MKNWTFVVLASLVLCLLGVLNGAVQGEDQQQEEYVIEHRVDNSEEFAEPMMRWIRENGGWVNRKRIQIVSHVEEAVSQKNSSIRLLVRRQSGVILRDPSSMASGDIRAFFDDNDIVLNPNRDFPPKLPATNLNPPPSWGSDPVLFLLPDACLLSADAARLHPQTKQLLALFDEEYDIAPEDTVLATIRLGVVVLGELLHLKESFWAPYLATFTWRSNFIGYLANDEDLAFLEALGSLGENMVERIIAFQQQARRVYNTLFEEQDRQAEASFSDLLFAVATAAARTDGKHFFPLLDLLNHNSNIVRNMRHIRYNGGMAVLPAVHYSDALIQPGQELLATYGPHRNQDLALAYGFVLHHNQFDSVCFASGCFTLAAARSLKLPQAEVESLQQFVAQYTDLLQNASSSHPPAHQVFLSWARELHATLKEFQSQLLINLELPFLTPAEQSQQLQQSAQQNNQQQASEHISDSLVNEEASL